MSIIVNFYKKQTNMNSNMRLYFILFFLLIIIPNAISQNRYRTQILNENIKTLQVKVNNDPLKLPIINLNSGSLFNIGFDELSHNIHSYSYDILLCNADWTLSNLSSNEYLNGFSNGYINDYKTSLNTTVLYTHYSFSLPNNNVSFKLAGNYMVNIYEDNDKSKSIATVCFSIVDPQINISAKVRGNTDTELYGAYQQLDFSLILNGFYVQDPQNMLKVIVRQNNRRDNEVIDIKPTYMTSNKIDFINNKNLIFEGGNEYYRFDISSIYNYSDRINSIKYVAPYYYAYLFPDEINTNSTYTTDFDSNGNFIVNYQNDDTDDEITADYLYVNFYLDKDQPFFDGNVFIGGEFDYNQFNAINSMDYDVDNHQYRKQILLKQGGYNYQYWLKNSSEKKATVAQIDGSFWQTQNQYAIYIYYRGFGDRYDKLIATKILE